MKTISCVFTKVKLDLDKPFTGRIYTYNVDGDIKLGDMIQVSGTRQPIQVVGTHPEVFKFYNNDGSLSNDTGSPIKEIVITDNPNVVFGVIVEEQSSVL
jgi:hypothetical protein